MFMQLESTLRRLIDIYEARILNTGYSEHTLGVESTLAAVAQGATVKENHFTLDAAMASPDHRALLDPSELKHFFGSVRWTSSALGRHDERPTLLESKRIPIARKSIVSVGQFRRARSWTRTMSISNDQ